MRLTKTQCAAIKSIIAELVGDKSRVWLFGSRVDDNKRGGDIDLLIETDQIVPNRVALLCNLEAQLVMRLGERKIDVLLKDARTIDAPIFRVAPEQGVQL
jgi:predicted nucleotidyltransferase